MKKIIALVAVVCAVGAFSGRPSAGVASHPVVETLSTMAFAQVSRSLATESYDAI